MEKWGSAEEWPVGAHFVAVLIDDDLVMVWGGDQEQPGGGDSDFPPNLVFIYNLIARSWLRIEATGDIPSQSYLVAGAFCDGKVYLFGGGTGNSNRTNDVFFVFDRASSSGVFEKQAIVGDRPSPRCGHKAWTYKGLIITFGGSSATMTATTTISSRSSTRKRKSF